MLVELDPVGAFVGDAHQRSGLARAASIFVLAVTPLGVSSLLHSRSCKQGNRAGTSPVRFAIAGGAVERRFSASRLSSSSHPMIKEEEDNW